MNRTLAAKTHSFSRIYLWLIFGLTIATVKVVAGAGLANHPPAFNTSGLGMSQIATDQGLWLEAEAFEVFGSGWTEVADGSASGLAAMSGRGGRTTGDVGRLVGEVEFSEAGTYFIEVRGRIEGQLADDHSLAVGFDGDTMTTLGGFDLGYQWNTAEREPLVIAVEVDTPGIHTIDLQAQGSDVVIDAIFVTTDATVRSGDLQAVATSEFIETLGVNTHLNYYGTAYEDIDAVLGSLNYIGFSYTRDTIFNNTELLGKFDELGANGIKVNFFVNGEVGRPVNGLSWQIEALAERAHMISTIEGPNETDNWPVEWDGLSGLDATGPFMYALKDAVEANSALAQIDIVQASFGSASAYFQVGDLSEAATYSNPHAYFSWGAPPGAYIDDRIREAQIVSPGDTPIATEAGYHNATGITQWNVGLTEDVHAKYMPRLLLEQYARGVERTFVYELFDINSDAPLDQWSDHFGLFHSDGSPKEAATALHNLTALLVDDNDVSDPDSLRYTLTDMPETADDLLFQKSNGDFSIVVWNDVLSWDAEKAAPLPQATVGVTLDFAGGSYDVRVFDVLSSAKTPVRTIAATNQVTIDLPDHPLVIELTPIDDATPADGGGSGGIPRPDGGETPDTLTVRVAAQSWNGDPQFEVLVDGTVVGSGETAASLADGAWEDVVFTGDFGEPASVAVRFLNDAYDGSPDRDRNLYVDRIELNGEIYEAEDADNAAGGTQDGMASLMRSGLLEFDLAAMAAGDTLTVRVAAQSWNGDPQFEVLVDGTVVGSGETAASLADGAWEDVVFTGDFGEPASVAVRFLNDAYDGSPDRDRNLYVDRIELNGEIYEAEDADNAAGGTQDGMASLMRSGLLEFDLAAMVAGDTLTVRVAAQSWNGDPQFEVLVDGTVVGSGETAASLADGAWEDVVFTGDFGEPASVAVRFLNDAYDGSPDRDRNLYVDRIELNGEIYEAEDADNAAGGTQDGMASLMRSGLLEFDLAAMAAGDTLPLI